MMDDDYRPPGGCGSRRKADPRNRITQPQYTPAALAARIEGFVELSAVISEHGIPEQLEVITPLGYGLDEKAIECVREWRVFTDSLSTAPRKGRLFVKFELPPNLN